MEQPPERHEDDDFDDLEDVEEIDDDDEDEEEKGWAYQVGRFVAFVIAVPLLVTFLVLVAALVAGVILGIGMLGWAMYHADPGELTPKDDPGYIDLIVTNRWVVWGLRAGLLGGVATLLVLALFVVTSIVVRARRGEWLRSGGGLQTEINAAEKEIAQADRVLVSLLTEAQREKDELTKQLAETTDLLDWVLAQEANRQDEESVNGD